MGNTRVTFTDSANVARSLSENHYYPFGMSFAGIPQKQTGNLYLYNGKELQNDFGLDWYDFRHRFYNPVIGRFISIDPIAEKYYFNSTYAFAENKLGMGNELEGLELVPTWHEYMQAGAASGQSTTQVSDNIQKGAFRVVNAVANGVKKVCADGALEGHSDGANTGGIGWHLPGAPSANLDINAKGFNATGTVGVSTDGQKTSVKTEVGVTSSETPEASVKLYISIPIVVGAGTDNVTCKGSATVGDPPFTAAIKFDTNGNVKLDVGIGLSTNPKSSVSGETTIVGTNKYDFKK